MERIRLLEIRTREQERIQIPIPSYGYGATRRSRFAFGRITTLQARTNTARHFRPSTPEENLEENDDNPYTNVEPEPEEEDLFINEEVPDKDDCA